MAKSDMIQRSKLIEALSEVQNRKTEDPTIVQSREISRKSRELLIKTGWLREIIKGWYLFVRPDAPNQDSTVWYAHFWDFLAVYLKKMYKDNYCLTAEASIDILLEKPTTPKQVIVITTKGGSGVPRTLPYQTSILIYSDRKNLPKERITFRKLQVMPLPLALCRVPAIFFRSSPIDAEIALKSIKTPSLLSQFILKYDLKKSAERLIGAYEFLNLQKFSSQLKTELEDFGMKLIPENPFIQNKPLLHAHRSTSPYAGRIEAIWSQLREPIIDNFPKSTSRKINVKKYFDEIDALYKEDAYHSLSIEGFQVTPELIERVKNNNWNPDLYQNDRDLRNALAARGYYEAFQNTKKSIHKILEEHENPGEVVENNLQPWFRSLFLPSVEAGIISEQDLIGYRKHRVHIRNSRHTPPSPEAVLDAMETFFNCLKKEAEASVRVILGHYIFVYIHPYMDGNGRIARFLMNTMLASGGYHWTVVPMERREIYMSALETAHVENNIVPFTKLIVSLINKTQKYTE